MKHDLRRWPEADDLLDEALALPAIERRAYVRQQAADPALAEALEAVLDEATSRDDFLPAGGAWSGPLAGELQRELDEAPPTLAPGAWVEHYEVVQAIGRGGMGEVYRARDTRLGRDVALKVLPARYARDPDRQARFKREARVLASLNHPGIASIYGVAEAENIEALVLELVDGPTLADIVQAGPLPLDQVLSIAPQLVDALAVAHARGILHRDLKPANIKIAPPATVKILDFGLARALAPLDRDEAAVELTHPSAQALLGTASYMSPEQARGRPADERADIWAFGCVLFEMLTGTRAFGGTSVTDVLAAVLEREPAFSLLPATTPDPIRRLLRRCLEKNPERRLGFIGDARLELDDAAAPTLDVPEVTPRWRRSAVAGLLGVALIALGGAGSLYVTRTPASAPVSRLLMPLPTGDVPVTGYQPMTAVSPDGRTVVYRARRGTVTQLFRRDLDALEAVPIPGTEGGTAPFFSPDGRWLAFDADGVLKRVALAGGTPVVICSAPGGVTAAWLSDDTIVLATNTTRVLQRVPASGGTPESITTLDGQRGDTLHLLPQELPGGRAVLFTVVTGAARHVAVLDLGAGEVTVLADGSHARYVGDNTVVFLRDGTAWASRFDPSRLTLVDHAVPLDERIAQTDNTVFHYATAAGMLAYLPPQRTGGSRQRLAWIDKAGVETPLSIEPRAYVRLALSPDNERVAVTLEEDDNQDIWIVEPRRNTLSRLTFESTIETMPTWTPDGRHVAFRSEREGPGVFRRDASGTGSTERITATDGPIHSPYSWTPDGRTLLLAVFRSFRNQAIASVTPPETTPQILLDGDFAQLDPHVSADGRWMAYQSDETGRFEIYVRPYPDVQTGRWLVSTAGGTSPRWSPDGRELFYYDGESLVGVPITTRGGFSAGRPTPLFRVQPFGGRLGPDYEVAADGRRFLFLLPGPPAARDPAALVVVQNWIGELRAKLAQGR